MRMKNKKSILYCNRQVFFFFRRRRGTGLRKQSKKSNSLWVCSMHLFMCVFFFFSHLNLHLPDGWVFSLHVSLTTSAWRSIEFPLSYVYIYMHIYIYIYVSLLTHYLSPLLDASCLFLAFSSPPAVLAYYFTLFFCVCVWVLLFLFALNWLFFFSCYGFSLQLQRKSEAEKRERHEICFIFFCGRVCLHYHYYYYYYCHCSRWKGHELNYDLCFFFFLLLLLVLLLLFVRPPL